MTQYELTWTCWNCDRDNREMLTKYQAAFREALNLQKTFKCRNCGRNKSRSSACLMPDPDDPELLSAWLSDRKLFFLSQDEELVLADVRASLLIELIESEETPRRRRGMLFMALLYKTSGDAFKSAEDRDHAKAYLQERRSDWFGRKEIPFRVRKQVARTLDE